MRFYKFALHKAYFDKGMGLTSYFKYMIAFFGLASNDIKLTMIIAVSYGIFCYVLGRIWYYAGGTEAELEVINQYDLFVKEVRKELSGAKTLNNR